MASDAVQDEGDNRMQRIICMKKWDFFVYALEGKEMIEINLTTGKQIQNYLLNVR